MVKMECGHAMLHPGGVVQLETRVESAQIKLSVGSGIEVVVSNPARPIRTVYFHYPTDRLAESPTGLRSLSKSTLDFEEIRATGRPDTEFKRLKLKYDEPLSNFTFNFNMRHYVPGMRGIPVRPLSPARDGCWSCS